MCFWRSDVAIGGMDDLTQRRLLHLARHLRSDDASCYGTEPKLQLACCRAAQEQRDQPQQGQQRLRGKLATPAEAAALVRDGDRLTIAGFVGCSAPDLLLSALRERFDASGAPRGLALLLVATTSDGKGRGCDRLAKEGLLASVVYAWAGNCPNLARMVREGSVQAWNLPLGIGACA